MLKTPVTWYSLLFLDEILLRKDQCIYVHTELCDFKKYLVKSRHFESGPV